MCGPEFGLIIAARTLTAAGAVANDTADVHYTMQTRGIFTSEDDLAQQMLAFIETYNQTAKPFTWTYTGKTLNA